MITGLKRQGNEVMTKSDSPAVDSPALPAPWPLWAQPFRLLAVPGDRGLGDIVHRQLGGDAFPAWYARTLGGNCGCADRVAALNRRWPR